MIIGVVAAVVVAAAVVAAVVVAAHDGDNDGKINGKLVSKLIRKSVHNNFSRFGQRDIELQRFRRREFCSLQTIFCHLKVYISWI